MLRLLLAWGAALDAVHPARGATAFLALDVKVILTPPCLFHQWFSIQNIQGGVRMTLASTS